MATKAKTQPAPKTAVVPSPVAPYPLASAFAAAVKFVNTGNYAEASTALQSLVQEAQVAGDWAVKRRAQVYLTLAESKLHPAKESTADPVTEIQACLNRHQTDEALKLSEKAIKGHPAKASLHYLRSVAFAQAENTEAAAESLKKAVDLEPDFVYQWHMERDYDSIRKSPLFAFTEGH